MMPPDRGAGTGDGQLDMASLKGEGATVDKVKTGWASLGAKLRVGRHLLGGPGSC